MASISTNFASFLKGEFSILFAYSSTNRAAAVFPTPGGPYIITCCGFGPQIAAFKAFTPSFCPIISSKDEGLLFSVNGSVNLTLLNLINFSISFLFSLSITFTLL